LDESQSHPGQEGGDGLSRYFNLDQMGLLFRWQHFFMPVAQTADFINTLFFI
jgi:hypothetical protein